MGIDIKQSHEKEIIVLDTFQAIRHRPEMYISQVRPMDDKVAIIENNKLIQVDKTWSPGLIHLLVEILENSIDEAKRCKGKMKNIYVTVNLDTNEVSIKDEGMGFHNAAGIHKKTKKNVVRTALEELHAGSNFIDSSINILGTHGVGSAVCNILSKKFSVTTINKNDYVHIEWDDYKVIKEEIRRKKPSELMGTTINFIPSPEVFGNQKWDPQIINTYLSFKYFLISQDDKINNLKINGDFIINAEKRPIEISKTFIPKNHVHVKSKFGDIFIWPSYENSCSVSFVNGSLCTGIHQKIVNDWCNEYFEYNLAHHFYETLISINVPSHLMRFSDQNKTKYSITRPEIENELVDSFKTKLISKLNTSTLKDEIIKQIEIRQYSENISKIRKAQKISKRKISEKYTPPTKQYTNIFICEGLSASGSLKQARNIETDAVYALKGKIKNTKRLSDLSENNEIMEIMSILDIEPGNESCGKYNNIIICTDNDIDGQHIEGLLINFFYKWFPHLIKKGKLYQLITPLVVCTHDKERKYFYTLEEYLSFAKKNKVTNSNYLKGLGSLSIQDWEYVMNNKKLFKIIEDSNSAKYLDIAFGDNVQKRKNWLQTY